VFQLSTLIFLTLLFLFRYYVNYESSIDSYFVSCYHNSNQGFDIRDRSVASVTFDSANNSKALLLVGEYIDQLRLSLAKEMKR
jgi:hypothetical protein